MSLLIAWVIIGTITFVGILAEYVEEGLWEKSDLWGVPMGGLLLMAAGPLPYLVAFYNERKKLARKESEE
jgi:cytochrome c oxidase assembly factor CtaG